MMTALRWLHLRLPVRAWLFALWWRWPPGSLRDLGFFSAAALGSAALLVGVQGSELREQLQAAEDRTLSLERQREGLQRQRHEQQAQLSQASTEAAAPAAPALAWQWHAQAMAAGLRLEQLKPVPVSPQSGAQWQMRLRGRYAQQGAFVAALAAAQPALRLVRYHLQASPDGVHPAELIVAQPDPASGVGAWAPEELPRRYGGALHSDPMGEPPPADPWADLPGPWRARAQAPRGLLEEAPLSTYAFSGTLRQGAEWVALLRGQGMTHTVRAGDRLGPHLGHVLRIDEQGLWLREIVRDGGRWVERERPWRVGEAP